MNWFKFVNKSDFKTLFLGGSGIVFTILSFSILALWLNRSDMGLVLGMAPLSLCQNLFEAGLVYRIPEAPEQFRPRERFRLGLSATALGLAALPYMVLGSIPFGYLASIVLKTVLAILFIGIANRTKEFNYERFGRLAGALITLVGSLSVGVSAHLGWRSGIALVRTWIDMQLVISLGSILAVFLYRKRKGFWTTFQSARLKTYQVAEDLGLMFVSLAGLLMYSWWPLFFAAFPGRSMGQNYNQLGIFYLLYSLVGPILLKKALLELRPSNDQSCRLLRALRVSNLGLLVLMLVSSRIVADGHGVSRMAVILGGLLVVINEGVATILFSTRIVSSATKVRRYSMGIVASVFVATLASELLRLPFPGYIAMMTTLVSLVAYPGFAQPTDAEGGS